MAVRCRGRLTLYEARGKFQMSVADIEPTGAGALALAFEQLKQRLDAEGLFDAARKRPLPLLPRRIGVVTSPQGAVMRDIIRVAHRRFPVPILLAPAPVQGEGAALAIAAALRRLAAVADVDVIIVARGGGSLEDLWAFNEEPVARAIVACRVPVISAVGHETDFTIADFVADLRAPTPSAAAELAVPMRGRAGRRAGAPATTRRPSAGRASARAPATALERARARLGDPRRLLDERRQRLDETVERGRRVARAPADRRARRAAAPSTIASTARTRSAASSSSARALAAVRHRLEATIALPWCARRHAIEAAGGKLEALSPVRVLERGLQPDPARRGPPHHHRRRGRAPASAVPSACATASSTPPSTRPADEGRRRRDDPRRRPGRRRQQEPLARHPQRRLPGAGDRRRVRARSASRPPVPPAGDELRADGYRYLNVTIPHKLAAAALADRQGPEVRASRAPPTR